MQDTLVILVAGIFLSLFPLSMLFNLVFDKVIASWIRVIILLCWPLIGIFILNQVNPVIPDWILPLSLFTSFLYALRLLTLREVNQWSGFLATSLWSLLWIPVELGASSEMLYIYALAITVPLALLVLLSSELEKRYGAAFTDLYGGLARTMPRFSGILVIVIIAAIATPIFPTFFIVLEMIIKTVSVTPYAAFSLLIIWLLWSWAGARIIQGLIVGRKSRTKIADLDSFMMSFYSLVLVLLAASGIYISGVIL